MSYRVLIADDEPNIVASLEFLMRGSDYDVRIARDGEEALRLAGSFRPDVILLDAMMPQRSGFEVCRRIREDPALQGMIVVMLTARGRNAEADRELDRGVNAYVTKPFSTKELMSTVRALLQSVPQAEGLSR